MISASSRSTIFSVVILAVVVVVALLIAERFPADPLQMILLIIASIVAGYLLLRTPLVFIGLYYAGVVLVRGFVYTGIGPAYITELFLAALLLQRLLTGNLTASTRPLVVNRRVVVPMLGLMFLAAVSLIRGYHNGVLAARDSVIVFYGGMALLIPTIFKSWKDFRRFTNWMILTGIILNILLIYRLFTEGLGVSEMATPRLFGARTSGFLFFVGALALTGVHGRRPSTRRFLRYFGVAQFCLIILLSGTRNVWIASAATFMFWSLFIRRTSLSIDTVLRYVGLLVVFVAVILLMSSSQYTGDSMEEGFRRAASSIFEYEQSASASNRIEWWTEAVEVTFDESPLLGRPFGSMTLFMKYDTKYGRESRMAFHNSYVTTLWFTGFPGLALLLLLLLRVLRLGIRNCRRSGSEAIRKMNIAFTVSCFFYCVIAFFNVILEGPQSAMLFWLMPGLLMALHVLPNATATVVSAEQGLDAPVAAGV
jgi:O-antigen ligase